MNNINNIFRDKAYIITIKSLIHQEENNNCKFYAYFINLAFKNIKQTYEQSTRK